MQARLRRSGWLPACDAVEDRVVGLDSGGDDYLTKPFAFAELCARIDGCPLALSVKEFSHLRMLAAHAQTVVSRVGILDEVWGSPGHSESTVVDQHVSYLRRKLESGDAGVRITTLRRAGYQLDIDTVREGRSPALGRSVSTSLWAAPPEVCEVTQVGRTRSTTFLVEERRGRVSTGNR
ncbi:MAG: response regulator transcription factor [Microbacteriaceae bacterium]|nr:response regulator transcription factor [Microbacteriaceae bacterium]